MFHSNCFMKYLCNIYKKLWFSIFLKIYIFIWLATYKCCISIERHFKDKSNGVSHMFVTLFSKKLAWVGYLPSHNFCYKLWLEVKLRSMKVTERSRSLKKDRNEFSNQELVYLHVFLVWIGHILKYIQFTHI